LVWKVEKQDEKITLLVKLDKKISTAQKKNRKKKDVPYRKLNHIV